MLVQNASEDAQRYVLANHIELGLGPSGFLRTDYHRQQCDGQHPCSACTSRDPHSCVYEVHQRTAVRIMKDRIVALNARCNNQEKVLKAIATGEHGEEVVRQLQDGQDYESFASQLPNVSPYSPEGYTSPGDMPQSATEAEMIPRSRADESEASMSYGTRPYVARTCDTPTDFDEDPQSPYLHSRSTPKYGKRPSKPEMLRTGHVDSEHVTIRRNLSTLEKTLQSNPKLEGRDFTDPTEPWTTVTEDEGLVRHLLGIYFCWEYPAFSTLHKSHFLHDFDRGRRRFCSSLLVNAILSLACKYTDKQEARADPDDNSTAGDDFFEEAQRLLYIESDPSLPTIQALQLMSLREASCGHDSSSWFYSSHAIRLAIKAGLHLDNPDRNISDYPKKEWEVRLSTFWGCFAIDQ